jgi:hypothetical protein
VLCLNVSAGIGVIGMASPMLQEIFGGKLIGHPELGFNALGGDQKAAIAAIAAGFAGLLSLFNIGGRFFWASLSDYIGRKNTYYNLYDFTMYILCGMLVIGLLCNLLVKPVSTKWYMSADEVAKLQAASSASMASVGSFGIGKGGLDWQAAVFWSFVGIPLAWGVWITLKSAAVLFH